MRENNSRTEVFTSVWSREPRRPRATGLDRDQIVAAAVTLLDRDGLEALSMRKLGAALGAGATSIYWYVPNKDELLELALDEFWSELDLPESDAAGWQQIATAFAYSLRQTLHAHPWAAALIGTLPSVGPNAWRLTSRLRDTFAGAGFTGQDMYFASSTILGFVLGQVIPEIAFRKALDGKEYDQQSATATITRLAADYPDLIADHQAAVEMDPHAARAMAFDFGLSCILDGLAAKLDPERAGRTSLANPAEGVARQ
ncbi:TetR family transcriptional regulator [Nocardia panacis]|uniref:TetR family transcriptional regulator n=1 Tax=Nocardia panacis TaxID=2340916 RepID=A0A3A4L0R4_9NOCA|nr:TetR family transcriptional regulator [Nocardia panacis]